MQKVKRRIFELSNLTHAPLLEISTGTFRVRPQIAEQSLKNFASTGWAKCHAFGGPGARYEQKVQRRFCEWPNLTHAPLLEISTGTFRVRPQDAEQSLKNFASTGWAKCHAFGGPPGARTRDPLIKSQVLYRLS